MRKQLYTQSKCSIYCIHENENLELESKLVEQGLPTFNTANNNLFVYPAQSNFNGRKYSLDLIKKVKANCLDVSSQGDWFVLLDTASLVSTSELNLNEHKPDFCVASFYKIFGFPTGLGCVLIRKDSRVKRCLSNKKYFGGGTIHSASIDSNSVYIKDSFYDFMEDGTLSYLDIVALSVAVDKFETITFNQGFILIRKYLENLTNFLVKGLEDLKHFNGNSLVEIYRVKNVNHGPIIAFNLKNYKRKYISFNLVDKLAQQNHIHLRTGCFCNIGACQKFMSHLKENNNFYDQGHKCGDHIDMINGEPTGAIRVSLGYCSTKNDTEIFLKFLVEYFLEKVEPVQNKLINNTKKKLSKQYFKIVDILIYPIKSCGPMRIKDAWPIKMDLNGLAYDRYWIIVDNNGVPLTQKRWPLLIKIKPVVNLNSKILELKFEKDSFHLDLDSPVGSLAIINVYIYPNNILGLDEGHEVSDWLRKKLNVECRLIRIAEKESITSFYNKEAYLLVNLRSIQKLKNFTSTNGDLVMQFRPNFVINTLDDNGDEVNTQDYDFEEDQWTRMEILNKKLEFKVSDKCNRCQMININQEASSKGSNLNSSLLKDLYTMKSDSKFGIYLTHLNHKFEQQVIEIGDIGVAYI